MSIVIQNAARNVARNAAPDAVRPEVRRRDPLASAERVQGALMLAALALGAAGVAGAPPRPAPAGRKGF